MMDIQFPNPWLCLFVVAFFPITVPVMFVTAGVCYLIEKISKWCGSK